MHKDTITKHKTPTSYEYTQHTTQSKSKFKYSFLLRTSTQVQKKNMLLISRFINLMDSSRDDDDSGMVVVVVVMMIQNE